MSTGALELDEKAVRDEHGAEAGAPIEARSPLELYWSRLRKDRVALAGLAFVGRQPSRGILGLARGGSPTWN